MPRAARSPIVWIALACVAIVVLGAVTAVLIVDAEQFRPTLQRQLEKALARPVQLGKLKHTIFPFALQADALQVGEDPRFGNGAFLSAREIKVHANLWPLLINQRVEIQSVEIVEPKAELIRRNGVWNYESLGGKKESPAGSTNAIQVERVDIVHGQVAATLDGEPRVVYPKTTLTVTNIAKGSASLTYSATGAVFGLSGNLIGKAGLKDGAVAGSFSLNDGRIGKAAIGPLTGKFDLTARTTDTTIRSIELLLGKLALRANGSIRDQQLALDLEMPRAPIADLVQLAAAFGQGLPPALLVNGQLEGKLQVRGTAAEPTIIGRINAGELTLSGGAVKREVRSRAVTIDLLPEAIRSSPFEVVCGRTKLSGYFSVRDYATKPLLESAVLTDDSDIADLLQIAQAYGAAEAGLQASGKATLRLRIHGPLAKGVPLQMSGKGNLEGVTFQSAKMNQPVKLDRADISFPSPTEGTVSIGRLEFEKLVLTTVRANTTYRNGILRLDPLTAGLYGGATSGRIAIDTRGANSTITLESRLEKIESGQLLSAISNLPQFISGPFTSDVKLTFAPKGNEEPLRALVGNVTLKFSGGKLHTMNLLGELNGIAKFIGGPKLDEKFTSFLSMQGELALDKGVVQTDGIKFDLADATATFAGGVNFVDQTLNMKLMSILNAKLAETVGGTRIGGYLTSAVRNANGELIIPTLVSGTLSKPRLLPDAPAIAKLKLQNALPNVLDAVKDGKVGLKDVLGILGGARKKKE